MSDLVPFLVDNTILSTFKVCQRKGMYRHIEHLTPPITAPPLNFNSAVHVGIAAYLRGKDKLESIKEALVGFQYTTMKEKEWRTPDRLVALLEKLLVPEEWIGIEPLENNGVKAVEIDFQQPLYSAKIVLEEERNLDAKLLACGYNGIHYIGIIDLIANWNGSLYVFDHKGVSLLDGNTNKGEQKSIRSSWWTGYKTNAQITGYLWAARQITGLDFKGAVVNGIGCNSYGIAFGRQALSISQSEMDEWKLDVLACVERILDSKIRGYYEKASDPHACTSYNTACPYLQLCSVPKESREAFKRMYEVKPWEPLKVRKQAVEEE